jgi:hypothetical protein
MKITAGAVTNSIGHTVANIAFADDTFCKTDCFKIETKLHGSSMFDTECKFEDLSAKSKRKFVVGDAIGNSDDELDLIGQYLYENGVSLKTNIRPMIWRRPGHQKNVKEIWTERLRLRVLYGRVYGHLLDTEVYKQREAMRVAREQSEIERQHRQKMAKQREERSEKLKEANLTIRRLKAEISFQAITGLKPKGTLTKAEKRERWFAQMPGLRERVEKSEKEN